MSHVTITLGVNEKLAPKYKIVVAKKAKLPPGEENRSGKKRAPKPKAEAEKSAEPKQKQKPNFFQKVFRRKAGMGQ